VDAAAGAGRKDDGDDEEGAVGGCVKEVAAGAVALAGEAVGGQEAILAFHPTGDVRFYGRDAVPVVWVLANGSGDIRGKRLDIVNVRHGGPPEVLGCSLRNSARKGLTA
jgi:hypothetical protein